MGRVSDSELRGAEANVGDGVFSSFLMVSQDSDEEPLGLLSSPLSLKPGEFGEVPASFALLAGGSLK